MASSAAVGNGGTKFFDGGISICIFSEWGVTGKIFGLLLAYNQVLLVLVGRRWSCWGRRFTDET
jgi:hypothetical protein